MNMSVVTPTLLTHDVNGDPVALGAVLEELAGGS